MDISSVSRNFSTAAVQGANTQRRDSSIPPAASTGGGAAQVQLSKPGELLKKLSDLQQSDPAKFKEVVQQISDAFASAAKDATGDDATALSDLADKFAQAAQSGDMSALRPEHGHRPPPAQSGTQSGYDSQGASRKQPPAPSQAMQDAWSAALSLVS